MASPGRARTGPTGGNAVSMSVAVGSSTLQYRLYAPLKPAPPCADGVPGGRTSKHVARLRGWQILDTGLTWDPGSTGLAWPHKSSGERWAGERLATVPA